MGSEEIGCGGMAVNECAQMVEGDSKMANEGSVLSLLFLVVL